MNNYIRHGTASLKDIIEAVLENWAAPENLKKRMQLHGFKVGLGSLRLKTFARAYQNTGAVHCVTCGLKAEFFSVDSFPAHSIKPSAHLNLYGTKTDVDGNKHDVLFTHDHILARGLGGVDDLSNTQPMCSPCNGKKSRAEGKLAEKLRKERLEKEALLNPPVDPQVDLA